MAKFLALRLALIGTMQVKNVALLLSLAFAVMFITGWPKD
jgi:hypothetical protein